MLNALLSYFLTFEISINCSNTLYTKNIQEEKIYRSLLGHWGVDNALVCISIVV